MGDTDDPSCCQDDPEPRSASGQVDQIGLIDLIDHGGLADARARGWLTDHAQRLLAHLGLEGELRIELVDDAQMSAAHQRWKNDPATTDVLTFDLRACRTDPLDTDLMVCVDEAHRQSLARGIPIEHELLLYIVHGLLHCLGHDDQNPADAQAMHVREDELLAALGLRAVYAAGEADVNGAGR